MRITESKLRSIIRSVLKEQGEFDRFNIEPGTSISLDDPSNSEFKEYFDQFLDQRILRCDELIKTLNNEIKFHESMGRDLETRLGSAGEWSAGEELLKAIEIIEGIKRQCEQTRNSTTY